MGNPTLTGTLPAAEWRVKRNLPGPEGGACEAGQTGPFVENCLLTGWEVVLAYMLA